ncbi:ABC transporter ATP-binding protein [Psychroserpens sp.]|uniref:ABC transporter ATP-binding protein n=1 Tax=Psychroserpens sp. TaxID=2020870 RepID=UPI001B00989B|nr:ABC transporter ATP-binding protein [Psychroserpens sp.]MBO6606947.1 ATP-binding cassette domain-containing protein [Psychroserpens sp.]MBO6630833.1 ATP-binding cassette domain-containing protein [Psychroserpens sp.]MBO6654093.1 ATP-binding cassette domain-containing protein [Psychroserpens sp.]MBO6682621.1 ATP-binding cassette domain-containing protein [Psychroserpens sp.]MBO6750719.1 ATP-binding cassette domain-containing protein [Psychroserpens sp.]
MSEIILKATNISKQYRLGLIGTGTVKNDLKRWWYGLRGKEDPFLKVGDVNDRSTAGSSDYVWALKDINFEVKHGEVLGIIGKNGAGKSTLLKILSRVTGPTTGEIKTKGRIASLLEVGTGFHPELTGRENIYLNGGILGMTKAEIRSKESEIIEFSGCERYVDTPVKRYSSGMRVRLAFAVAAFLEPDILVIDEVLAVGDAEFQKKAVGKMQDISKGEGRTVLFVSHDMAAIQTLCSRLLILENGLLSYEGDVSKGVEHYLSSVKSGQLNYQNLNCTTGIKTITFLDDKDDHIESILVGQKIKIQVEYQNENSRDLSISLGFFDVFSNFKFACRSDIIDKTYNSQTGVATLTIDKWPLSEGIYYYNLAVHDKGVMIENVKEVGILNTERGDFYGNGKLPGHKKGFYIDYNWS